MIEGRLTLSGQASGFTTGDRMLELNWTINDGVGQFERFDVVSSQPMDRSVGGGATVAIFVPGVLAELEKALEVAEKNLTDFKPDSAKSDGENAADRTALESTRDSARDALNHGAEVTLKLGNGNEFSVSSHAATLLSIKSSDEATGFTIQSDEALEGCELIVL